MKRSEIRAVPTESAFAKSEYDARLARMRAAMRDADIEVLLLHSLPDICWLTGYQTPLADWYSCAIVPLQGEVVLQICDHELAAMYTYVDTFLTVSWEDMDAAAAQLVSHLCTIGASAACIGVQPRRPGLLPFTEQALRTGLPGARLVDIGKLVLRLRAVKSEAEIACLREAARLSTLGMRAAMASLRAGVTENDIVAAAMQAIAANGGEYFSIDPIVRSGPRSGVTHAMAKRRMVRPGDAILMEIGAVYQRYCAPLLRTAVIEKPNPQLQQLADVSLAAMELLFANLRAGRTAGDVASAAMKALSGLGPEVRMRGYFGYAVGIGFPPSWVERSTEIAVGRGEMLEAGMTFHLHRVLRVPGVVGVGFSETAVITARGYELLTQYPRELVVIGDGD
ncbi:MAG TPA: Xaa-Pro peptidase family protein [Gemmatimonadaceae bacterium]|nr:Xaa-Pro peptidase family protein [Gemmatimonadaceae bacterium]